MGRWHGAELPVPPRMVLGAAPGPRGWGNAANLGSKMLRGKGWSWGFWCFGNAPRGLLVLFQQLKTWQGKERNPS